MHFGQAFLVAKNELEGIPLQESCQLPVLPAKAYFLEGMFLAQNSKRPCFQVLPVPNKYSKLLNKALRQKEVAFQEKGITAPNG